MIKLFKKTRQILLKENRFGKYLLYALGEIVLVVFGILIALNINNRNELRKNEQISTSVLKQIQNNLLEDIYNSQVELEDFLKSYNNHLEILDFKNPRSRSSYLNNEFEYVGFNPVSFVINNYGYENLTRQIDKLPMAHSIVLPDLKILYIDMNARIQMANSRVREIVFNQINFISEQNWDLDRIKNFEASDEEVNYYVNDDSYKRYVIKFMNGRIVVFVNTQRFRIKAIDTYMKINAIIEKPLTRNLDTLNLLGLIGVGSPLEEYQGSYQVSDSETSDKMDFFIEGNKLFSMMNNDDATKSDQYLIKNKTFMFMDKSNIPVIWEFITDSSGAKKVECLFGDYSGHKTLKKIE
ncbi:hypothetical protein DNU06_09115 [Putridiphycobacter roseus]|uniref:Uncharacterized protein n=1 Tax=Putridiphycobacter roseus TaxID=2219161 RepID=A0A2W1N1I6_9FLAO|nr:DUF6090 family protein [Putridiphycobacter roseus]PZE17420.1 hypothetical protein DNU06_09115 [Putridiphycobacter roseus]